MATRYVNTAEMRAFISDDDLTIQGFIESAEAIFDILTGNKDGLIASNKIEAFPLCDTNQKIENRGRVFYLGNIHPTELVKVNGVAVANLQNKWEFDGQKLEFENVLDTPASFPYKYKIEYKSGYDAIGEQSPTNPLPIAVKTAIQYICAGLHSQKNVQGVSSFRQDLLTVTYDKSSILNAIGDESKANFVNRIIAEYTVPTLSVI